MASAGVQHPGGSQEKEIGEKWHFAAWAVAVVFPQGPLNQEEGLPVEGSMVEGGSEMRGRVPWGFCEESGW